MTTPAVSVLMLCYDRAHFMRQAMESVLAQTFGDFEFVVMDHGSKTPEPFNIAEEYAAKDSRMRAFRVDENRGVSAGRNRLLAEARGEFVATIEDDDWWAPGKLEKQTAFLRGHPEVGAFYCSSIVVDEAGNKTGEHILDGKTYPPGDKFNYPGRVYSGSGQLFRRAALNDIGGWREWFLAADDSDLFHRFQEKHGIHDSASPLFYYRKHGGNLTGGMSVPYDCAAKFSAHCRRAGKPDIIGDSPPLELALQRGAAAGVAPRRLIRKAAKAMLRLKMHAALWRFLDADKAAGGKNRSRLFFKLAYWSLVYKRAGFWLARGR